MERLFHVSEDPAISTFIPRPSPSFFAEIRGDVVFAITGQLLHNYLLPRHCPRVCYYAGEDSEAEDIEVLIGSTEARYVMVMESKWRPIIEAATLYCYELPVDTFSLLDTCAGYYISYEGVTPITREPVSNLLEALAARKVDVRFIENLRPLAEKVRASTLQFSLIRMRNAQ